MEGCFLKAAGCLHQQGVKVSNSAAFTPESNWLVERTHGTIMSLSCTVLLQAIMSDDFCHNPIIHVVQTKNGVEHRVTGKVPFSQCFGRNPPYVRYIRPCRCRAMYLPVQKTLLTFAPRFQKGVCVLHEGGGVYHVLAKNVVRCTKHMTFIETSFPGEDRRLGSKAAQDGFSDTVEESERTLANVSRVPTTTAIPH